MRSCATAALLLVAAVVSGCGPAASTDSAKKFQGAERDVAAVIDRLSAATNKRDAKKICRELLSPSSVAAIRKTQRKECVDGLRPLIGATTTREIKVDPSVVKAGPRLACQLLSRRLISAATAFGCAPPSTTHLWSCRLVPWGAA